MKAGGIYRLQNFYGSHNKTLYRVAEPAFTITFSSTSVLSDLEDSSVCFPEDRFRFHGYEEFDAACDLKGDLYDYVGHIKLVNGQVPNDILMLDEAQIASTRRVLLHVQTHDGPVMKLNLWDKAASDFSERFKASGGTASVILVTTLNPKRFRGALTLSSMTSSRIFMDSDIQATRDYLTWLNSNLAIANRVDANVVTKTETVTIGELFSYMKQAAAKADENVGADHLVPVPQALIDTIGQTRKFIVKVSNYNLTGKTQTLTVTKVLTPEDPEFEGNLEENVAVPDAQKTLQNGVAEDGPSTCFEESDGERVKRAADNVEAEEPKRAKCG
ncbi:hypothetical protein Bca52824_095548 [Brassica carinata]|uniref:Replication protein A OB domain-containing protein n=1 Tax=Brassica carinata TaxID=52824 RepID=A0A8X7TIT3_BRACI|nr:hypothetical protein Bca52824_095548 [Brassica carinata]